MFSTNKTYRMAFVLLALVLLLAIPVVTGAAGENGITSPEGGATISGSVEVTGVAADSNFEKWQLDIMVSGDEGSASFIALGEEQVAEEGALVTLDTTMYADGDYTLRLRVVGTDGQYDEYYTDVTIANGETPAAAPVAEEEADMADEADMAAEETATTEEVAAAPASVNGITSPEASASVSGSVDVMGVATDPNFEKWQLDIMISGDEGSASFIALGEEQVAEAATLATVDTTMYPDGDYTLRLRVVGTDGQYDEYYSDVTIANGETPAAAPVAEEEEVVADETDEAVAMDDEAAAMDDEAVAIG